MCLRVPARMRHGCWGCILCAACAGAILAIQAPISLAQHSQPSGGTQGATTPDSLPPLLRMFTLQQVSQAIQPLLSTPNPDKDIARVELAIPNPQVDPYKDALPHDRTFPRYWRAAIEPVSVPEGWTKVDGTISRLVRNDEVTGVRALIAAEAMDWREFNRRMESTISSGGSSKLVRVDHLFDDQGTDFLRVVHWGTGKNDTHYKELRCLCRDTWTWYCMTLSVISPINARMSLDAFVDQVRTAYPAFEGASAAMVTLPVPKRPKHD